MEKKKIEWLEEKYIAEAKKKNYWKLEEEILSYSGKDELGKSEVSKIVEWKNIGNSWCKRIKGIFSNNCESEVRRITKEVFEKLRGREDDEDAIKEAIENLGFDKDKLHGVNVRTATAILMAYNQAKFTVMDSRVWNILFLLCYLKEPFPGNVKPEDYIPYLKACRRLAGELGVDLRTLDRALWISSQNYPDD